MPEAPAPNPRASRRFLRRLTLVTAVVTVALAVLLAIAFTRAEREPAWWHQAAADSTPQQAESFEHALLAQLTRVRGSTTDSWSAALSEADLNAWLTHRLASWLANRDAAGALPENATVRVRLQADRLLIGLHSADALYWIATRPAFRDDRFHLEPIEAGIGDLALPLAIFRSRLPASLHNRLQQGLPAWTTIDRARVARLESAVCRPGELVITVQTVGRP